MTRLCHLLLLLLSTSTQAGQASTIELGFQGELTAGLNLEYEVVGDNVVEKFPAQAEFPLSIDGLLTINTITDTVVLHVVETVSTLSAARFDVRIARILNYEVKVGDKEYVSEVFTILPSLSLSWDGNAGTFDVGGLLPEWQLPGENDYVPYGYVPISASGNITQVILIPEPTTRGLVALASVGLLSRQLFRRREI